MREEVRKLWPELDWIADASVRDKVARTWERSIPSIRT